MILFFLINIQVISLFKIPVGRIIEVDCLSPISHDSANCIYGEVISMFFSRSFNIYFYFPP